MRALFALSVLLLSLWARHVHSYISRFSSGMAPSSAQAVRNKHWSVSERPDIVSGDGSPDAGDAPIDVIEYSENKGGNRMYGKKQVVQWNPSTMMFSTNTFSDASLSKGRNSISPLKFLTRVLYNNFIPSGNITDDYFTYSKWRACQRFVSATSSVFGTQALVMALGVKSGKNLGIAAATAWVMKDALGKVSRIFWASNFGRKFDSDAKKWRYRASLLYAAGSGLEVLTYVFPAYFLLTAATANGLKQMAMLTSSATRNAIYRSFARQSDNIGDVTAKGEAQIAVVDLLGIFAGVFISRLTTVSRVRLVSTFLTFSAIDLFCIYNEIQSVVFNALNYERTQIVLRDLLDKIEGASKAGGGALSALVPEKVGRDEKILLPATIRENVFSSWSGLCVSNRLLKESLEMFGEAGKKDGTECKFVVTLHAKVATVGETVAAKLGVGSNLPMWVRGIEIEGRSSHVPVVLIPQVLLHVGASREDMLRAFVVIHSVLRDFDRSSQSFSFKEVSWQVIRPLKNALLSLLSKGTPLEKAVANVEVLSQLRLDDEGLLSMLDKGRRVETRNFEEIKLSLQNAGWDTDKFMYSSVKSRVEF